ncbi:MAG: glycoside hydrolase family 130 protein [Planctomycetota bacterium]
MPELKRTDHRFLADDKRVMARFFGVGSDDRARKVITRVLDLGPDEAEAALENVLRRFAPRHRDIESAFERHFGYVQHHVTDPDALSLPEKLLIGAYFTMEYSIESAALFNPSIVPHPNQAGLPKGHLRFIMSLRATGEGHVSSIVFRTGVLDDKANATFDPAPRFAAKMRLKVDQSFDKHLFLLKLIEMGAYTDVAQVILDELPDPFSLPVLDQKIAEVRQREDRPHPFSETADNMHWLARSNYGLVIPENADASEIVIFPTSENESRGIEDLRLTPFINPDGSTTYFGTYSAYNGFKVLPQILETNDFHSIKVHTLNGRYVQNKGMALFPRKINDLYYMISRLDGENMFVMKSDNPYFWNESQRLCEPLYPWEFVQIGNCGAPIETPHGWLLLTHGVGPVREYAIGACLLDLDDPTKVIGHLQFPLITPNESERDGYVPNVVYTCGALVHAGQLVIPYAISDSATTMATTPLDDLVDELLNNSNACPLPDRRMVPR